MIDSGAGTRALLRYVHYQEFSREISEQRHLRFIIFSRFRGLALLATSNLNLEEIYADCVETVSTHIPSISEKPNWLTEKTSKSFLYFHWSIGYTNIPIVIKRLQSW